MSQSDVDVTPQADDESLAAAVCLSMVPGVGPRMWQLLLERFGSAQEVLRTDEGRLRQVAGVGAKLSRKIAAAREANDAEAELALCRQHAIELSIPGGPTYPRMLSEIPDPPGVLYCRGELLPQDAVAIAIVGTRHASQYGTKQAERLAAGLARAGLTIVSGLARGIDAVAHKAALEAGGRTIAVLASGLLNIYPPEHRQLADRIAQNGALVSEAPPRRGPLAGAFPQRNRIITGLSLGVIVVEAAQRSGALISARHALEQNREVFAVPGRVDSRMSVGCHRLIRDGARLVESVDDVLQELGPLVEPTVQPQGVEIRHPAELLLNEQERQVLDAIPSQPTTIDDVALASRLPVHRVLATVSVLEMRHLVQRVGGNRVARV